MMVGAVLFLLHPASVWMHLYLTGIIELIFSLKEGWTMTKADVVREMTSWIQRTKNCIIGSWEAHLPFRRSLLTSL
jgi:hypothetical protein